MSETNPWLVLWSVVVLEPNTTNTATVRSNWFTVFILILFFSLHHGQLWFGETPRLWWETTSQLFSRTDRLQRDSGEQRHHRDSGPAHQWLWSFVSCCRYSTWRFTHLLLPLKSHLNSTCVPAVRWWNQDGEAEQRPKQSRNRGGGRKWNHKEIQRGNHQVVREDRGAQWPDGGGKSAASACVFKPCLWVSLWVKVFIITRI